MLNLNKFVLFIIVCICCVTSKIQAQNDTEVVNDSIVVDENYREDQFYVGFTYNILQNRPSDVSQNNLSSGIYLGFIRDFPLNARRNKAIGIGLGYSYNSFFHNLKATPTDSGVLYEVIESDESYSRNKYRTHELELPIEFRWRTSTATDYKFWRIYAGLKFGYIFSGVSKFIGDSGKIKFQNDDFEKLRYGITLSAGYNTWNFHVYYGLNPLFKDGTVTATGEAFEMQIIKVGLMFYIL